MAVHIRPIQLPPLSSPKGGPRAEIRVGPEGTPAACCIDPSGGGDHEPVTSAKDGYQPGLTPRDVGCSDGHRPVIHRPHPCRRTRRASHRASQRASGPVAPAPRSGGRSTRRAPSAGPPSGGGGGCRSRPDLTRREGDEPGETEDRTTSGTQTTDTVR